MRFFFANLAVNLMSLSCVLIAGWLAAHHEDGWGWFLFAGLINAGTATIKEIKK
jgi:uncharacterized membrane protein HdeD (DUF308 family)